MAQPSLPELCQGKYIPLTLIPAESGFLVVVIRGHYKKWDSSNGTLQIQSSAKPSTAQELSFDLRPASFRVAGPNANIAEQMGFGKTIGCNKI